MAGPITIGPGAGTMSAQKALEETRRLVLLLKHLKHVLRQERTTFADKDLGDELNKAAGDVIYAPGSFNKLVKPDIWPDSNLRAKLFEAINKLAKQHNPVLTFDMPTIEAEYLGELPEQLQPLEELGAAATAHEGLELGPTARVLMGAWRLFFVVPIGSPGNRKHTIQCALAAYLPANPAQGSIKTRFIGSGEKWDAVTYVNDTHMFTVSTTPEKSEVSLILTNKPKISEKLTAGLCISLEGASRHAMPPAMAILTFGEKIEPTLSDSVDGVSAGLIDRFAAGKPITKDEEAALRKAFFIRIASIGELERRHKKMRNYLKRLTLNDSEIRLRSLLLEYTTPAAEL